MIPKFALLVVVFCEVAYSQFVERKPELGPFQDYEKCYPLQGTWYLTYRTHEHDGFFGGTAKCVSGQQVGSYQNYTTTIRVRHSPNVEVDTSLHIKASEGYTHRNVFTMSPLQDPSQHAEFPIIYADCSSCWVMRHPYIGDHACSVVKKDDHLGKKDLVCDFVYAVLCGSEKYVVSDTKCPN